MDDLLPPQVWLLIALAVAAAPPGRYLYDHIVHAPERRDITLPQEDLSWRTQGQFARSAAAVAILAAIAIFSFTPEAEQFARSDYFIAAIAAAFGLFALYSVVTGALQGRVKPLVQGLDNSYERETQPGRFWASMAWNGIATAGSVALAVAALSKEPDELCYDLNTLETAQAKLEACNTLLGEADGAVERAFILGSRGIAHHWLGNEREAVADYTRSLAEGPPDAQTLYNRAQLYREMGEWQRALADYDQSLKLYPNNGDAYLYRGLLHLDNRQFDMAIADLTRAHELDPKDVWPLANRGLASAWKNDRLAAQADFARVKAIDADNPVLLHGEAVLAIGEGNLPGAVAHLTHALRVDPNDEWALRKRGDVYWEMGLNAKAQDDDDKYNALRDRREGRR